MNRVAYSLFAFALLAGCTASTDPAPGAAESDYTGGTYAATMRAACLQALPEIPATTAEAVDDAELAELATRPELARGRLEIYDVSCSTRGYGPYETPSCARIASYEAINTNYSPSFRIEQGQSYRDVVAKVSSTGLVLATAVPDGGVFRPAFAVTGAPASLAVGMTPPSPSWTMPDDLARVGSYGRLDLAGSLTNGSLVLSHTNDPVVTWNVVQCTRAVLRMNFEPAKGAAN